MDNFWPSSEFGLEFTNTHGQARGIAQNKKRLGQSLSEKHKVFATYVKEEYIGTMGCPTSPMLYEAE